MLHFTATLPRGHCVQELVNVLVVHFDEGRLKKVVVDSGLGAVGGTLEEQGELAAQRSGVQAGSGAEVVGTKRQQNTRLGEEEREGREQSTF